MELVEESLADSARVEGLLCGAVKHLRNNKTRPDHAMCYGMLYLAKTKPFTFQKDIITEVFIIHLQLCLFEDSINSCLVYYSSFQFCNLKYLFYVISFMFHTQDISYYLFPHIYSMF